LTSDIVDKALSTLTRETLSAEIGANIVAFLSVKKLIA